MNIKSQQLKFYLALVFVCLCDLPVFPSSVAQSKETKPERVLGLGQ